MYPSAFLFHIATPFLACLKKVFVLPMLHETDLTDKETDTHVVSMLVHMFLHHNVKNDFPQ